MIDVSIVTTCKGRLAHLRLSVPQLCEQDVDCEYEVIVVDYDCPDGAARWCIEEAKWPRLRCVRATEGARQFNLSRARNIGGQAADSRARCLVFTDADIIVQPGWLRAATEKILNGEWVLGLPQWRHKQVGTVAVARSAYFETRGYDEALVGWGYEDQDFVERLKKLGDWGRYPAAGLISVRRHMNDLRVQYYDAKIRTRSKRRNQRVARQRVGLPNPAGFGEGWAEVPREAG